MKNLHETSLRESWDIQKRVIGALLMREIITRYGRKNIGFLWLFVEPLIMTLFMVMLWHFLRADKVSSLNIVAFVITGYPMAMMWRNASNRAIGAIAGNIGLLYHRNVRVLDTIFARMILEIAGATIAQIVIMTLLIAIGWIDFPADPMYMVFAWLLMAMFAVGLGLIICSIAFRFDVFGKLWGVLSFILLPISGVFFFVNSLPVQVQEIALRVPMIHGTEMLRHGYFGNNVVTMEQPWFLFLCNLALLLLGLLMVRAFSDGVEPE